MPGDSVSTVEFYDPFAGRWQLASSMCTLRSRVGIAVFKGMFPTEDSCMCKLFRANLATVCLLISREQTRKFSTCVENSYFGYNS